MRIRHGTVDWDTLEEACGAWYLALRGGRLGFSGADEVASRLCYHVEKTRTEAATEQLRITLRPTCPKPVVAVEAP